MILFLEGNKCNDWNQKGIVVIKKIEKNKVNFLIKYEK